MTKSKKAPVIHVVENGEAFERSPEGEATHVAVPLDEYERLVDAAQTMRYIEGLSHAAQAEFYWNRKMQLDGGWRMRVQADDGFFEVKRASTVRGLLR
jgi:hypothetical protein